MTVTKLLLVADLHGSEVVMNKTVNSAKFYGVKDLIVAGDITGKVLVPILERPDGTLACDLHGVNREFPRTELPDIQKQIRNAGFYFTMVSPAEYDELAADKSKQRAVFLREMLADLTRFYAKAHEKLQPLGTRVYLLAGNDDYPEVAEFIRTTPSDVVVAFDEQVVEFRDSYQIAGYGYSNPTPWFTPREIPEAQLLEGLRKVVRTADPKRTLLVAHAPPRDTIIDKAPQLTPDLRPVMKAGQLVMASVGSTSVRTVLEEFRPIVGLHGHIHESSGRDFVGAPRKGDRIPVFNPGSEYNAGVLRGVLITLENGAVRDYMFTKG
ncbi:MAG: metallophosphoesterase [Thermoplasmata archaeon]